MEEMLIKAVANLGIPAAICFYVLFIGNRTLKELNTTVLNNTKALERLRDYHEQIDLLINEVKEMKLRFEVYHNASTEHHRE